jgi:hypothetical protein
MHPYVVTRSRPYHRSFWSTKPLGLRASNLSPLPTCPLEGFAFAYFPTAGCGISFALAAPMATIFSIMP